MTDDERRDVDTRGRDDQARNLDERLSGSGTEFEREGVDRAGTDPLIDPAWPDQAQRIIGQKHARSASQPGDVEPPDADSEANAAEIRGPKSQSEPDNTEYEHKNQARWREIKM